ncbi:MAG: hydrogenase maturation protease [Candidatus Loosdrechtia sp.]|uniref:hydrogenase maturation protease n=1 Tax=Candidatus Loosdrechtia sp. TaxID=3101272 RepID=UPI003A789844|nr:MAG: hydrogenase maturation protease [Candidatus Jettenia sp. AMX2]
MTIPYYLIIGIGNWHRGDDAAGIVVARHVKQHIQNGISVIEESDGGVSLIETWKDSNSVIIIDAMYSGARPGTIHRFDAVIRPLPSELFRSSTHIFGIAGTIELARAINRLPPHVIIYGIEGKFFGAGIGLSPEVEAAVHHVSNMIAQDVLPPPG